MRILFLSRWFPFPADNGSKLRVYNLIKVLSRHHTVTLLSFTDKPEIDREAPEIRALCAEVCVVPWKEFDPGSLKARTGFFSLSPRSILDTFSVRMAGEISRTLQGSKFNLVIASQLPMAAYYRYFHGVPALFEELELGLAFQDLPQSRGWKEKLRHGLTQLKLRFYLGRLLSGFKAVTVVSERERDLASRLFSRVDHIMVVPNCIDFEDYQKAPAGERCNRLIFTGSFRYEANYEAMRWFVGQVFPRILEQKPGTELVITGDHAGLPFPSDENIILTGHVKDIRGMISSSAVSIAPMLSGGGTRLKILEAMALGTPVVATSKGAEGLAVRGGEHVLIADDPAAFSACVLRLLGDEKLRGDLSVRARCLVQEQYSWGPVLPGFLQLVESLDEQDIAG